MSDELTEQLDELGELLLALDEELSRLLADEDDSTRPVALDQQMVGRVSRIDAIQQQQMAQAGRGALEQRLRQVRAARRRLAEDDYGFCEACDRPIGYARLKVRPEAALCVSCQEQREG